MESRMEDSFQSAVFNYMTQRLTCFFPSRSFLVRAYPTMKAKNPQTPIMIREAMDVEPKVWARYEYGKEKMIPLKGGLAIRN
jgi:hypothetical protein